MVKMMSENTLCYALHVFIVDRKLSDNAATSQSSVLNFGSEIEADLAYERLEERYAKYDAGCVSVFITKLY